MKEWHRHERGSLDKRAKVHGADKLNLHSAQVILEKIHIEDYKSFRSLPMVE
jgi:hypothetical protein